ncbi:GNAT family N-acetyltransferase [Ferrovibrio terrae]|uniref:GNAT family N-acetyltransferase n=1 Tax=Ferrovibrio terrae TaxID=2594003 RepID=UPI003137969A
MSEIVTDNTERQQYEMAIDGQIVFARYRRHDGVVSILHVEAPVNLRGSGAAGRLMQGIVELARRQNEKLVPLCSYAAAWMRRHPESADLLA